MIRMYPPVPIGFARFVPPGGTELNGYYIPEGNRVVVYQLATYRDPGLWRNPEDFCPERWLGDEKFKNDHLASLEPFSTGPRACPGKVRLPKALPPTRKRADAELSQNFAWNEMRLILATVLLKFDFRLRPESDGWTDQKVFLVWEKHPLWVDVKSRNAE